ncbi:hypothetical protein DTL42_19845 [Bremerella cremea]|uniref:Uncharacterized protein n=1 Tax=Bremerella cremea TaxID=1031537 RepID=A0A368KLT2_9BACT|nr:hypothetical protein [Bremerella cremea]RCS42084.1 hypothetical protein DTL42_19845 [Bremerella cremea]
MLIRIALFLVLISFAPATAWAQAIAIPGQGQRIWFDDLEDEEWEYTDNHPKSSHEQDNNIRLPGGISKNKKWGESSKRGHPDYIRRVETPEGGIPGSNGSLLMMTLQSNVPNRVSNTLGQDDFICRVPGRYSVSQYPSAMTRVYLPPFEKWEQYAGAATFGFRTTCVGSRSKQKGVGLFSYRGTETEENWPGIFLEFRPGKDGKEPEAQWIIRGAPSGDVRSLKVTADQLGWWTIGMSFTPDGRCHYFISEGAEDLTQKDLVASYLPYNYKIETVSGMFFNVFNYDNGKSWSTPWVIDDPGFYIGRR